MKKIIRKCKEFGVKEVLRKAGNRAVRKIRNTRPLWTPRQFHIPLEEVEIGSPVFFLGVQGGGLTLLSRMLRRSGQFITIGGGSSFWTGNDEMDKFHVGHELLPDEMALRSPGYENMTGREEDHPVFGLERSWVYATNELLPRYRMTNDDHSEKLEREFKNFIRRSIRAYSSNGWSGRFLDMSQSYTLKIPLLRTFFPDVRFVLVARNPYVMCWREATRRPDWKYRRWNERPSLEGGLRLAAQHWKNSYRVAIRDLEDEGDGIFVRFEDAISHPEDTVKRIASHVGVSYDQDMIPSPHHSLPAGSKETEKWSPLREDVNKKYKEGITGEAIRIIESEIKNISKKLSYQ